MRSALLWICLSGCTPAPEPIDSDVVVAADDPAWWGGPFRDNTAPPPPPKDDTDDTDIIDDTDDTDVINDTDPPPFAMSGDLHWMSEVDGKVECDADVAVTAEHRRTLCTDCDATWNVKTTVTEDRGAAACNLSRAELLREGGPDWLGWAPRWTDPFTDRVTEKALVYGTNDGIGESWRAILSGTDPRGGPSLSDSALRWTHSRVWGQLTGPPAGWDTCDGPVRESTMSSAPVGKHKVTNSIPCDGSRMDVWTITVSERARLVLDTTDPASPFDPWLFVNDEDSCTTWEADDNIACTHPPPSFACPAGYLEAGTWTVHVGSRGECRDGLVNYALRVDGSRAPSFVLSVDDAHAGPVEVHRVTWTGDLTLHR